MAAAVFGFLFVIGCLALVFALLPENPPSKSALQLDIEAQQRKRAVMQKMIEFARANRR